MSADKREEKDANRRRRVEVDQALHQLDTSLATFDEGIGEWVDADDWVDANDFKKWEPFIVLQKRKTVLDSLRKQTKEMADEMDIAIHEIELRSKLVRGLYPRKARSSHGPAGDASYKEARLWINSVMLKLHMTLSGIIRNARKKSAGHIAFNGKSGRLGNGHVLTSRFDPEEEHLVTTIRYHQGKLEKMRLLLDKERVEPEDVISIQVDIDQLLYDLETGTEVSPDAEAIWDCVDLGSDNSNPEPAEADGGPAADAATPTTPSTPEQETERRSGCKKRTSRKKSN